MFNVGAPVPVVTLDAPTALAAPNLNALKPQNTVVPPVRVTDSVND
jgi:hypothetical protein